MKNNILKSIYIFLLSTLIVSCAIGEAFESTKVKRFKNARYTKVTDSLVNVSLFSTRVTSIKPKENINSLWNLSDRGQAELIESYNSRDTSSKKFITNLNRKYLTKKPVPIKDYTKKNLRIILSISKPNRYSSIAINSKDLSQVGFSNSDRIQYLNLNLSIPDSSFIKFSKWNKFETEYKTIEIGDVSFNKSFSVTGGVNGSKNKNNTSILDEGNNTIVNSTGITPTISSTISNATTENQKVQYRYLSLHGTMKEHQILIEQEGVREIDLAGNIALDVEFQFEKSPLTIISFASLFKPDKKPNSLDKVTFNTIQALVPNVTHKANVITATLDYNYIYRHTRNKKGKKTFYEWDDKVVFYENKNQCTIPLFKPQDYLPPFQEIYFDTEKMNLLNKFLPNKKKPLFAIENYNQARDFINWLIQMSFKTKNDIHKLNIDILKEKNSSKRKKLQDKLNILTNDFNKVITFDQYNLTVGNLNIPLTKKLVTLQGTKLKPIKYYK